MPENAQCTTSKTRNGGKGLLLVYYIRRAPRTTSARMYACMINPSPPCLPLSHVPHPPPPNTVQAARGHSRPYYTTTSRKMYGVRTHNTRSYARCIQDRWEGSMCEPISPLQCRRSISFLFSRPPKSPSSLSSVFFESASLDLDENPRVCGGRTGEKKGTRTNGEVANTNFCSFRPIRERKEKREERAEREGSEG